MYGKNWRYLMMTLVSAKKADPAMLFFAITGTDGKVLACDDESLVGRDRFDLTRTADPDAPFFFDRKPRLTAGLKFFTLVWTDTGKGKSGW